MKYLTACVCLLTQSVTLFAGAGTIVFDAYEGREMQIYLPDGYEDSRSSYPVVYMHDGQNLFSEETAYAAEWEVDEALDRMIAEGTVEPMIVVGIYNSSKRANEYVPFFPEQDMPRFGLVGESEAIEYLDFVAEGIIPYIESKYRASKGAENRALIGSSFGGLNAFWAGYEKAELFSVIGAMSPSFWVDNHEIRNYLEDKPAPELKIWVDIGTREWDPNTPMIIEELSKTTHRFGENLFYLEDADAPHFETAWAGRVAYPLILFKGRSEGEVESLKVDVEAIIDFFENTYFRVNPIVTMSNGLKRSLLHTASYEVLSGDVRINAQGEMTLPSQNPSKVKVSYGGFSEVIEIDPSQLDQQLQQLRNPGS
jgi:predicted alpha/beta superfamily hydrolase